MNPTSSLSQGEVDRLFEVIESAERLGCKRDLYFPSAWLRSRSWPIASACCVMVKMRESLDREEIGHDRMVQMMVGRDVSQYYNHTPHQTDAVVMDVENLRTYCLSGP